MTTTLDPRRVLGALGLATLLTLTACGGGGDDDASDDTTTTAADEATTTAAETTTTAAATTEAPATTAAPATTEPAGGFERYSFSDDFSTDTGWLIGCNEGQGCALVRDGELTEAVDASRIEIDQHSEWQGQILTNVTIETLLGDYGDGNPEGGAVCHYDPEAGSYYDFTVGADGRGSLYKFTGSGSEPLAGPFDAPIFTGFAERITGTCEVQADGSVRLTMTVNGEQVADVVDSSDPLLPGQVGLVTYGDTGIDSQVTYDEVSVEADIYVE